MTGRFSIEERALIRGERVSEADLESLRGWYPVTVGSDGLWWRFFGEKRFSEPFFHDTLTRLGHERRECLHTAFDAPAVFDDALAPAAFVFHVSRCGSTLLTQLLASSPECIALSEPPAIDSFLRRYHEGSIRGDAEKILRGIVAALGQKRYAEERHLFIKLDSWHIASLPLFRRAFPDTPFLFMYREPDKVLASHRRQRGRQMVPGLVNAALPRSASLPDASGDLDAYCVSVLEYFFGCACLHAGELIFINYRQMPQLAWEGLPDLLGVPLAPEILDAMRRRASQHSKWGEVFAGDPPALEHEGEPCAPIHPLYEKLERLRLEQNLFAPAARP